MLLLLSSIWFVISISSVRKNLYCILSISRHFPINVNQFWFFSVKTRGVCAIFCNIVLPHFPTYYDIMWMSSFKAWDWQCSGKLEQNAWNAIIWPQLLPGRTNWLIFMRKVNSFLIALSQFRVAIFAIENGWGPFKENWRGMWWPGPACGWNQGDTSSSNNPITASFSSAQHPAILAPKICFTS